MSQLRILVLGLLSLTLSGTLSAQPPPKADPRAELASKLATTIPGTTVDQLRATPIDGVYELTRGSDIAYITADGKYAISGDLYDLTTNKDLTEARRRETRTKLIGAIPESEMLVFAPKDPKYTVTVFTDVDCGYCRKLHSQIAQYNRLGVKVRYLFFPRTGPNTESWTKAEEVWCSPNRNEALTRAKLGQDPQAKPCANNPVAKHYALGRDFGVEGTPAIVLADGQMLPGYLPPEMLLQELRKSQSR